MASNPPESDPATSAGGERVVYLSRHSGRDPRWRWSGPLLWVVMGVALVGVGLLGGLVACWAWRRVDDLPLGTEATVGIIVGVAGWVCLLVARWIWWQGKPRPVPPPRPWNERLSRAGAVAVMLVTGIVSFLVVCDDGGPDDCDRTPAADAGEVMVVWTDTELAAFCDMVAAYGDGDDVDVEVNSVGTEIGAELDARFGNDDPPDVAIIPQASLVRRYGEEGCLERLDDDNDGNMVNRLPASWNRFVITSPPTGESRQWGVFVKGADKSMFWYSIDALEGASPAPQDWSWGDLAGWAQEHTTDATAPLTLAAADRWPLTDWFENQLAAIDPELYDRLSRATQVDWSAPEVQDSVRSALQQMVDLWSEDDVFAEDVADTRLADLDDTLRDDGLRSSSAPASWPGRRTCTATAASTSSASRRSTGEARASSAVTSPSSPPSRRGRSTATSSSSG